MPRKTTAKSEKASGGSALVSVKPTKVTGGLGLNGNIHRGKDRQRARPELYINREVAAVAFIRRVLEEAQSPRHALLDRVRFLSFVGSQFDEFLMVRMAGLYDLAAAQVKESGPDGLLPGEQIEVLQPLLLDLVREQRRYFQDELLPRLDEAGIHLLNYSALSRSQREAADSYFRSDILPVLTPLGVDPAHPFPHISSRSLNLAVTLRDPMAAALFARIKLPETLRRFVPAPPRNRGRSREQTHVRSSSFVWLEQLVAAHLDLLFPGLEITGAYPFRVLRDADIEIQSDEAGDLLESIEKGLRQRRFGSVVNLAIQPGTPKKVRELLRANLELSPDQVWEVEGPLGLSDVVELTDLDRPDLKDPPLIPRVQPELRRGQDLFAAIKRGDLLLHHPYDAFSTVTDFIEAAAHDPQVLAIKQTLYRVGQNSPIVQALLEANSLGKQVAVLVELKARFDEENNIEWARTLEHAGVHVVYGQVDLKTHAKVALVVRRETNGLRRYVHLGTGNYNASTARVYEDFALLTCRKDIGEDVTNLFNALTGYARGITYHKLLVAPGSLRAGLLARIHREIIRKKETGSGRIIFKFNALVDPEIIQSLYRASQAGVEIDLLVRGICSLRPGIPGVSEHIRVISLVGRTLEHSRIYYFANGGQDQEDVLMGSADLMQRNLDHRIELLFPIEDVALRAHVAHEVLPVYLRDTANARILLPDGSYQRLQPPRGEHAFDAQAWFAHEGQQPPDLQAPFVLQSSAPPVTVEGAPAAMPS
ncbi:MAG TPA: polyphosphate kinase 1 [Ktedonobacterales bacterium]|nr:polyphosphate kinase 1 [Ktedonobacterales bacterium]